MSESDAYTLALIKGYTIAHRYGKNMRECLGCKKTVQRTYAGHCADCFLKRFRD